MCCILVVREEFIATHGDLVRRYLQLLLSTNAYLSANHGGCAKIQEQYTGVSADIIEHILAKGDIRFDDMLPDRGRIESLMHLAVKAGVIDRPCDLDRFLRADLL